MAVSGTKLTRCELMGKTLQDATLRLAGYAFAGTLVLATIAYSY